MTWKHYMDKRRLYDINKECSGNRMILNKRLKEDEHQSLTISYEEFENIKDIEYKLTDDTRCLDLATMCGRTDERVEPD
jgi:hypothetical protein